MQQHGAWNLPLNDGNQEINTEVEYAVQNNNSKIEVQSAKASPTA